MPAGVSTASGLDLRRANPLRGEDVADYCRRRPRHADIDSTWLQLFRSPRSSRPQGTLTEAPPPPPMPARCRALEPCGGLGQPPRRAREGWRARAEARFALIGAGTPGEKWRGRATGRERGRQADRRARLAGTAFSPSSLCSSPLCLERPPRQRRERALDDIRFERAASGSRRTTMSYQLDDRPAGAQKRSRRRRG